MTFIVPALVFALSLLATAGAAFGRDGDAGLSGVAVAVAADPGGRLAVVGHEEGYVDLVDTASQRVRARVKLPAGASGVITRSHQARHAG